MTRLRRSPTREMVTLRDSLDRFFDERFFTPMFGTETTNETIPLDIVEEGGDLKVKVLCQGSNLKTCTSKSLTTGCTFGAKPKKTKNARTKPTICVNTATAVSNAR
jgi:hypothetical protein